MSGHRSHPEFSVIRFFNFLQKIGGETGLKQLLENYNRPHNLTKRAIADQHNISESYLSSHLTNCCDVYIVLREEAEEALKYHHNLQERQDERIRGTKARIFHLAPRSDENQEEAGQ